MTEYLVKGTNFTDTGCKDLEVVETEMPSGIHTHLGLNNKAIYQRKAAFRYFNHAPEADRRFSVERTDIIDKLIAAV